MPSPQLQHPSIPSPATSASSPTSSSSATPSSRRGGRARVSAEHTLNRVRENQRRHRARQRSHVAALEQKLAETEALLAAARAEIVALKKEKRQSTCINQEYCVEVQEGAKEGERKEGQDDYLIGDADGDEDRGLSLAFGSVSGAEFEEVDTGLPEETEQLLLEGGEVNALTSLAHPSSNTPAATTSSPTTTTTTTSTISSYDDLSFPPYYDTLPDPLSLTPESQPTGPPPCCQDPPFTFPTPFSPSSSPLPPSLDPECTSCKTRPPPSPTESTTLCAQAYVMIRQQNFRNLDPDTIRMWLAQGLRRAQREGEGCRVENGALLRLLDFISGM
ncbi:Trappc4 Sedlin [Pyrenophora seminiperda CCB06]|uniref:Trappc4 Sedlin n=1 Tax=Pyrenophora seminiperda CCB06 TaxID=1302712 RepID=A0A3M7M1V7_9PLEO|nr:Trappc4 Sedlin [Pyrenophora seminiperda CCB06]